VSARVNMAVGGKPHLLRRDGQWRCCFVAYPEKWGPPDYRQGCLVTGSFYEASWQAAFLGPGFPQAAVHRSLRRHFGRLRRGN
jgi:hypothetical protein